VHLIAVSVLGLVGTVGPLPAQSQQIGDSFYVRMGGGLSDYAGDTSPSTGFGDFVDGNKFRDDDPFPFTVFGEVGYQYTPSFGVGVGYQYGQYPFSNTLEDRLDEPIGTARHLVHVLGRYTVQPLDWRVTPYFDVGASVAFGGHEVGIGPAFGVGATTALTDRFSLFLEARISTTLGDEAVDGIDGTGALDALSVLPGAGVRLNLQSNGSSPKVETLRGPSALQSGETATFTARTNTEETHHPVQYRWKVGSEEIGTSLTASHTFVRPGQHTVSFTASNRAGRDRRSIVVRVEPLPEPARISSMEATPDPARAGTPVEFVATVGGDPPFSYSWHLGNGTARSGKIVTHTYRKPGTYTVRLTVSNDGGTESKTLDLRVRPSAPSSSGEGHQRNNTDPHKSVGPAHSDAWSIVVASMRKEANAQTLLDKYRERFEGLPVDVVEAELDRGRRLRVIIGRFSSREDAKSARHRRADALPPDAWLLHLS